MLKRGFLSIYSRTSFNKLLQCLSDHMELIWTLLEQSMASDHRGNKTIKAHYPTWPKWFELADPLTLLDLKALACVAKKHLCRFGKGNINVKKKKWANDALVSRKSSMLLSRLSCRCWRSIQCQRRVTGLYKCCLYTHRCREKWGNTPVGNLLETL